MRGSSGFSAFAGAKHALRALAAEHGPRARPQGVPLVAHVIIDGAIDTEFIRTNFPSVPR